MMFLQPIILVSEFFQHVVVIVLAGYLAVELFVGHSTHSTVRDEVLSLFLGVVAIGGAIIGEYFIVLETVQQELLFHLPAVLAGLYALWYIVRVRSRQEACPGFPLLTGLFGALLPLLLVEVAVGVYSDSVRFLPWGEFVTSVTKTAEVAVLYFFVLIYTIRMDQAGRGALTCAYDLDAIAR